MRLQLPLSLDFRLKRPARFDEFTIEEALVPILANLIATRKPMVVVELGSGLSTVVIAKVIELLSLPTMGPSFATFVSIDEDERYVRRTRAWLQAEGLVHRVAFQVAPCADNGWYGLPESPVQSLDFLFVDGPSSRVEGDNVRASALSFFKPHLTATSAILVVDAKRDQWMVRDWLDEWPHARATYYDTERGAALLEVG